MCVALDWVETEMRLLAPICLAATLTVVTAAEAQTATPSLAESDARCLLAMAALSNSSDQNAARFGQAGVVYFAGRVGARDPNFNFTRLKTMAATMNSQIAQNELQQRCGPMLNSALSNLQAALAPPPSATTPAPAKPAAPAQH
jgi:hypothetical protein